ncbi:MAG TPA: LemA family protein [Roseiflexaceae bacterium]|nr:LemA family protein [Roseiflexaceae bacterium]
MTGIAVIVIILVVVGLVLLLMYNGLIGKKNQVDNVYASVDTLLKKRYDLIPNLVASVQQYMAHERELLTEVTELRTRALASAGGGSLDDQVALNSQLGAALGRVMVAAEAYPDLKANQNFLQLQGSLNEVEEQISAARRAYNAAVTDYNNALQMVPTNMIASAMGLKPRTLFVAQEAERQNVDVAALFNKR